jgi:hypothetical protein
MVVREIEFFYKGRKHYGTVTKLSIPERTTYRIDVYTYHTFLMYQLEDESWACSDPTVNPEYIKLIAEVLSEESLR